MADDKNTRAAFGIYPKARRAEKNNARDAAKEAPLQALRGWAAGTLGLPGDIEGLARMLLKAGASPGSYIERNVDDQPTLPTSEFYKEWLPGRDERRTASAFTDLGSLAGGVGAGTLARLAARGTAGTARVAGEALNRAMLEGTGPLARVVPEAARPAFVLKPKGGNWLGGENGYSAERRLGLLKQEQDPAMLRVLRDADPAFIDQAALARMTSDAEALNRWIDTKLGKYVRNEMATPEDPLRALALRGVSTLSEQELTRAARGSFAETARARRAEAGYPPEGYAMREFEAGASPEELADYQRAAGWEAIADSAVDFNRAGDVRNAPFLVKDNPWLEKVDPEARVYGLNMEFGDAGFDNLTEGLRNMLGRYDELPNQLRLAPKDLDKMNVPQAVQRVHDYNQWIEAQKAAERAVNARNAATALFKSYPENNPMGLSWVELKTPEAQLPQGYRVEQMRGGVYQVFDESGGIRGAGLTPEAAISDATELGRQDTLQKALSYEGDAMGHCAGGYCDDVSSGKTRIFSLRDKKDEPHVTIETRRGRPIYDLNHLYPAQMEGIERELPGVFDRFRAFHEATGGDGNPVGSGEFWDWLKMDDPDALQRLLDKRQPEMIYQIKGKQNAAPKREYLPFVQDFVKSGDWADNIGDFHNTGLELARERFNPQALRILELSGRPVPKFATREEIEGLRKFLSEIPEEQHRALATADLNKALDEGIDWEPERPPVLFPQEGAPRVERPFQLDAEDPDDAAAAQVFLQRAQAARRRELGGPRRAGEDDAAHELRMRQFREEFPQPNPDDDIQFARGGAVNASAADTDDYDPATIEELARQLSEELNG